MPIPPAIMKLTGAPAGRWSLRRRAPADAGAPTPSPLR